MKRRSLGAVLLVAGLVLGCGEGRAIFNVDVYSFFKSSLRDTLAYGAPPFTPTITMSNPALKITLPPGLGSSFVDTVKVTGTGSFINSSGGPATVSFQVYIAADSAGTYNAAARDSLMNPPASATVSGSSTTPVAFGIPNLSPKGDSLFTHDEVWVRLAATAGNPNATILQGKAVLTGLQVRLVIEDKIF